MWAVEFLGEELHCLGLKVQQAAVREEPSSTHHPGAESERPGARPMRRGRRGLVNGQSEKGPSLLAGLGE